VDQKLMREFVEKKLKRGGYTNIAAANFPCGVWIKEDTKLYAVCLFDDPNKLAADPWRIDRVVDYAAQKVREQKQLECQFLALVLSDDFSISKQLVTGFYPRWFIDDAGQPVIFDGQPSEFCDLYATLIRKERFSDRFNGKRIAINRIPEVTLMLVILNILIQCIVAVGEIGGKESALMNMMVSLFKSQSGGVLLQAFFFTLDGIIYLTICLFFCILVHWQSVVLESGVFLVYI